MPDLVFPDAPHCHAHAIDPIFRYSEIPIIWRDAKTDYRSCSYCGSLHPADLTLWVEQRGARLELADMKYGWPHKFYIRYESQKPAGYAPIKFYSEHLLDIEDDYTFHYLSGLLAQRGGVQFIRRGTQLGWRTYP